MSAASTMPRPPLQAPAEALPGHFRHGGGRGVFQRRVKFFATDAYVTLARGGSGQHSRTEQGANSQCTSGTSIAETSRHGARYGHEHCDLPNNLGLPLEPGRSSAPRRRGTAQAGGALGVRETSRNSAPCDRTRVRAVRVLGSRGSEHLGLKSMTPQREDMATKHQAEAT